MKHTVVIPLYNKEAYIFDTIQSLAHQQKKPYEIIIIDDCSTDKSLRKLREALSAFAPLFSETIIHIVESKENKGPGNVRNKGLELATGDTISFLDADDCYTPQCLKRIGIIMEQDQIDVLVLGIRLVPSQYYMPNIQSFKEELMQISEELFLIPDFLHTISSPDFIIGAGSNVVIQRKHLKDLRYDTSVSLNEGIDFWYRVLKNLPDLSKVGLLNTTCIEVREVEGSLSRLNYRNWKELDVPLTIKRYSGSSDRYDQQLMGMLSQRWFEHAMERLPSRKQKVLFVLNHLKLLLKNRYYFKKRERYVR